MILVSFRKVDNFDGGKQRYEETVEGSESQNIYVEGDRKFSFFDGSQAVSAGFCSKGTFED